MIKQKTNPWGWPIDHSPLLRKQRMINSREELAEPGDSNENRASPTPPWASPSHQTASEQISFHKRKWDANRFFSKWFHEEWACLTGFSEPGLILQAGELGDVPLLLALPHHLLPGGRQRKVPPFRSKFTSASAFSLNDVQPAWSYM